MQATQIINSLFCLLLAFPLSIHFLQPDRSSEIDRLMTTLHERGQFNGSIIVAIRGKAIYRKAFGEASFQSHRKFAPETISNIGSVSKQFTRLNMMMLSDQHIVSYDDPV